MEQAKPPLKSQVLGGVKSAGVGAVNNMDEKS